MTGACLLNTLWSHEVTLRSNILLALFKTLVADASPTGTRNRHCPQPRGIAKQNQQSKFSVNR